MRTTIDRGGRVVIPKSIRAELGVSPGDEVDVELDGWAIRIERRRGDAKLVERNGLLVVEGAGSAMTDDDLRALRLGIQR